eukprot:m.128804 g.128804  ORF g.128804 m.128804 type:complete len:58 (-) comp16748_c0_seq2:326-499(-)
MGPGRMALAWGGLIIAGAVTFVFAKQDLDSRRQADIIARGKPFAKPRKPAAEGEDSG